MTEQADTHSKARAWQALGLGPLWMVTGPRSPAPDQDKSEPSANFVQAIEQAEATVENTTPIIAPEVVTATDVAQPIEQTMHAVSWDQLQEMVKGCTDCALSESRTHTVFGVGDRKPRWLIIGEAPGANEDKQGEPFVGEAGQLLNAMLGAMGVSRDRGVFILNVLKCRPPGNRDPEPDEVHSCSRYMARQIQLLAPELIITMGRFAAQALLNTDKGIGALRGKVHEVQIGERLVPLVAGYHPAYLLRRPEEKSKAWRDLCLARSVCNPGE